MLGKAIRYEFKSTVRLFLSMYLVLIVIAAINLLIISWSDSGSETGSVLESMRDIFTGLFMLLYVLLVIATAVITLVIVLMRFYKLLGDEGYLWFTLPVTPRQHIFAKLITAITWCVASVIAIIASLLVLFGRMDFFGSLSDMLHQLTALGFNVPVWVILFIVGLLFSGISSIMIFYTSMSIGPHLTKNRLGGSVLAYIIAYIVSEIVATVVTFVGFFSIDRVTIMELDSIDAATVRLYLGETGALPPSMVETINRFGLTTFFVLVATSVIFAVTGYIITHYMLNKKLNLA
jgi:hypothetical protein